MSGWTSLARAPSWRSLGLALVAGALLPLAFAPFNLWPLAILCPALLMRLWSNQSPRRAAWLGFAFGVGTFSAGTWWLYISIRGFGGAPIVLAVALIVLLVLLMASYYALLGWLGARILPAQGPWRWYVGLPALWLLCEWWRGWFLSGFPWFSLGYSQTDTWLASYAPVMGVYGISALLLVQAGALAGLARGRPRSAAVAAALIVLIWAGGRGPDRCGLDATAWQRAAGRDPPGSHSAG